MNQNSQKVRFGALTASAAIEQTNVVGRFKKMLRYNDTKTMEMNEMRDVTDRGNGV